ncbi:hypothetical protein BGZ76_006088, partial [Entomortierella beljakovae]
GISSGISAPMESNSHYHRSYNNPQNPNHIHQQYAHHHLQSQHHQQMVLQQQQAQAQQQLRQQQQQMEYQRMQSIHPFATPTSNPIYPSATTATTASSIATASVSTATTATATSVSTTTNTAASPGSLQQRRASNQLALSATVTTLEVPGEGGRTRGGGTGNTNATTLSKSVFQNRIQTPLSPRDWQGLVASGAQPVRQALHSFIAASCEKPPETKEEARAVLEVMFQIRADKIRQAIEEGQLATAEGLKHKVIQRRESVVE